MSWRWELGYIVFFLEWICLFQPMELFLFLAKLHNDKKVCNVIIALMDNQSVFSDNWPWVWILHWLQKLQSYLKINFFDVINNWYKIQVYYWGRLWGWKGISFWHLNQRVKSRYSLNVTLKQVLCSKSSASAWNSGLEHVLLSKQRFWRASWSVGSSCHSLGFFW